MTELNTSESAIITNKIRLKPMAYPPKCASFLRLNCKLTLDPGKLPFHEFDQQVVSNVACKQMES